MLPTEQPAAPHPDAAPDTSKLYDLCKQAEKLLEKLTTGLGQIGADPKAVDAVSQMADVVGKICNGLAKGMQHEQPPQQHTMASAADAMMADRRAAAQQPPA